MQQKNVQLQSLKQIQKLSPQQVLDVRLLELSTEELVQRIETELLENEALEKGDDSSEYPENLENEENTDDNNTVDSVLLDPEDDYDVNEHSVASTIDVASWQIRNEETFHDQLIEQLGEMTLSEKQNIMVNYLIGSLEEDGLLHKDLQKIADEMYLYVGVMVTPEEVEEGLHILQRFEPAGVGGRNLQECLLLQVERRPQDEMKARMVYVLQEQFENFCNNRWDKIAEQLQLSDQEAELVHKEMTRLNPRPGGSLHADGATPNTILPDFQITVEDDEVQVTLNNAIVPQLHISDSYLAAIEAAEKRDDLSKRETEELTYIRAKLERAQAFIESIRRRNATLLGTMRAIINQQKAYFLTGDEEALRPLTMRSVAEMAKVDISTVSRVCNSKFAQTPYGTYPLKHYFIERFTTKNNKQEVSTQQVREKLKELIDSEDKQNPYSDMQLQSLLAKAGFDMARRTVGKYREQLGVKIAKMRKE